MTRTAFGGAAVGRRQERTFDGRSFDATVPIAPNSRLQSDGHPRSPRRRARKPAAEASAARAEEATRVARASGSLRQLTAQHGSQRALVLVLSAASRYASRMANQLEWKRIKEVYGDKKEDTPTCSTYRAQVPGGWLVSVWAAPNTARGNAETNKHTFAGSVAFVPDPTHGWTLDDHPTQ
jgi:hypothetical protein